VLAALILVASAMSLTPLSATAAAPTPAIVYLAAGATVPAGTVEVQGTLAGATG